MFRSTQLVGFALILGILLSSAASAQSRIEQVVRGLDEPWAIDFLPDGTLLITEKDGRLLIWRESRLTEVSGAPKVADRGQGGLLDVTVARDFDQTRELWFSYSKRQSGGSGTALAAARLSEDGGRLENLRDLFVMKAGSSGGRHFGSRVVEAPDGKLFLTLGDRGDRPEAQNRENHIGTIVRINRDGSVPADNPFVAQAGIQPEIWSFGHRNIQGADIDPQGRLWTAEHGARGGDEVNLIRKAANYGWPVISYGKHYSGATIGEGTSKPGMEQPALYWDPSMAPSGLLAYSGDMFPEWQGDLFVGSLKFDYIARIETSGSDAREVSQIKNSATERVRDIVQGPRGGIWFISVGNGAVYRMTR